MNDQQAADLRLAKDILEQSIQLAASVKSLSEENLLLREQLAGWKLLTDECAQFVFEDYQINAVWENDKWGWQCVNNEGVDCGDLCESPVDCLMGIDNGGRMKTIAEQLAAGATLVVVPLDPQPPEGTTSCKPLGDGSYGIEMRRGDRLFDRIYPVTPGAPVPGREGYVWGDVRCVLGTEVAGECACIGQAIPIAIGDGDKWFWLVPAVPVKGE